MDCRVSLVLPQLPCRTFWAGFENMRGEHMRDSERCCIITVNLHMPSPPLPIPQPLLFSLSLTFPSVVCHDMPVRLRDPTTNEPRLLKLKDWPTGEDFSEKLPTRSASASVNSLLLLCLLYFSLVPRPHPPSHEEKWSGEPSRISWASTHFCDNVT